MIKDFLVSFKDNIKTKTTNPFFGTLIGVWIIHNYKFVYTLFNFEKSTKLKDKLEYMATYLDGWTFVWNLFVCTLIALCVMVISYLLINLARVIVLTSEEIIQPEVTSRIAPKRVVKIEKYDEQVTATKRLQKRYDEELEAKLQLQNKIDDLETKYQQKQNELVELEKVFNKRKETPEVVNLELEPEIDEILKKSNLSSFGADRLKKQVIDSNDNKSKYNLSEDEKKQIRDLRKNPPLMEEFDRITVYILKKQKVDLNSTVMDEFLMLDLVKITEEFETDRIYEFTERGRYLRDILLNGDAGDLNYAFGA
ncbi:hypothetical protein [Marinifilum sp. D737]|uniref:hypothetical protein n=1 Tax=Marinifilum sp. D737 TaxID=2969628 RepID=UPI002276959A|nr:hypothetical protein [Marinifilum sp. D737]MCY1635064.1 hypothetical protein [Marinifilum sp. D737]